MRDKCSHESCTLRGDREVESQLLGVDLEVEPTLHPHGKDLHPPHRQHVNPHAVPTELRYKRRRVRKYWRLCYASAGCCVGVSGH